MSRRWLLTALLLVLGQGAFATQVQVPRINASAAGIGAVGSVGTIGRAPISASLPGLSLSATVPGLPALSPVGGLATPKTALPSNIAGPAILPAPAAAITQGARAPATAPAISGPLAARVEARRARTAEAAEIAPIGKAGPALDAPMAGDAKKDEPYELTPLQKSRLITPESDEKVGKFLKMLGRLRKSWSSPYTYDQMGEAQRETAEAVGLDLEKDSNIPLVAPKGKHWLNRWAKYLGRTMGVRIYWAPLNNHAGGHGASYNDGGYIITDDAGAILKKPTSEFLHEFLHAFISRGRHAKKLRPLRTWFHSNGWHKFPAAEEHPKAGYVNHQSFTAEEIVTNLHTTYHRAKEALGILHKTVSKDASWGPDDMHADAQKVMRTIETPVFLNKSVGAMAGALAIGVAKASMWGWMGAEMEKSFGRMNRSIPYAGEIEKNKEADSAFYHASIGESGDKVEVEFLSVGRIRQEDPKARIFPVFFGNGEFSARVELSVEAVAKMPLDDPRAQEIIIREAAAILSPKLAALRDLTTMLGPSIERLAALHARGSKRVDLKLLEEIRGEARAAFLRAMRFFIRGPPEKPSV